MISEVISEAIGDTQALERIRPDLNIEKWSIWQPAKSKNPPSVRVFEREVTLPDGSKLTAQVEIGFTHEGTLTTEDQKAYYALVKTWEGVGCSTEEDTHLYLRKFTRLLKKGWGTNTRDRAIRSLLHLRSVPFTWVNSYYNAATGKTIEKLTRFTILSKLEIFSRKDNPESYHGAVTFRFDENILDCLSNNHTKPLLFDTAISFKSEIAQILYPHVDLVMADKYRYERRTEGLFDDLGLKGKEYKYPSARKRRLEPALKEMEGKPLSTGVLVKATLVKTKDGKDYKVVFEKKARRKSRKKSHDIQPDGERLTKRSIEQSDTSLSGLAQELYERGIKPKRVAIELCENHDESYIREKIETFDFFMEANDGTISDNPPGWLRAAIERDIEPTKKQIRASKTAVREQVEEQVRELEQEKGKIKKPYGEECDKIFEKIDVEHAEVVHEAMQEAVVEHAILSDKYDASKPFAEQSGFVQAMAKPKLRERFSEMFKEVDAKYGKEIERIDEQITALKGEIG